MVDIKNFKSLWEIYLYGEEMTLLKCFKIFLDNLEKVRLYNYKTVIEKFESEALGMTFLALLDSYDYIEYGTSIRFGWISYKAEILKTYFDTFTISELYESLYE